MTAHLRPTTYVHADNPRRAAFAIDDDRMPWPPFGKRGTCILAVAAQHFKPDWARYYSLSEKLAFLMTDITGGRVPLGDAETMTRELARDPAFSNLQQVVAEHTGYQLQVVPGIQGSMFAQAKGLGAELCHQRTELAQFLFNEHSFLELAHEFLPPTRQMRSDRGTLDLYSGLRSEVPADAITLHATLAPSEGLLTFPSGKVLPLVHTEIASTNVLFTMLAALTRVTAVHWRGAPPAGAPSDVTEHLLSGLGGHGWPFVTQLPVTVHESEGSTRGAALELQLNLAADPEAAGWLLENT